MERSEMAIKKLGNYESGDFVVRTLSEDLSFNSKRTKTKKCIKTTPPQKIKNKEFYSFFIW
jgi:hypothetical protein